MNFFHPSKITKRVSHSWEKRFIQSEIGCKNESGQPLPSITWLKSVGNLPEDRNEVMNGTLTIHSVTRNDGGIYICKAENVLGSATDTAQLVIFSRFAIQSPPS